jgi:hypothetical protein
VACATGFGNWSAPPLGRQIGTTAPGGGSGPGGHALVAAVRTAGCSRRRGASRRPATSTWEGAPDENHVERTDPLPARVAATARRPRGRSSRTSRRSRDPSGTRHDYSAERRAAARAPEAQRDREMFTRGQEAPPPHPPRASSPLRRPLAEAGEWQIVGARSCSVTTRRLSLPVRSGISVVRRSIPAGS